MRLLLEVFSVDGHLEGRLLPQDGGDPVPFSGVLALLAAIEAFSPGPPGCDAVAEG